MHQVDSYVYCGTIIDDRPVVWAFKVTELRKSAVRVSTPHPFLGKDIPFSDAFLTPEQAFRELHRRQNQVVAVTEQLLYERKTTLFRIQEIIEKSPSIKNVDWSFTERPGKATVVDKKDADE